MRYWLSLQNKNKTKGKKKIYNWTSTEKQMEMRKMKSEVLVKIAITFIPIKPIQWTAGAFIFAINSKIDKRILETTYTYICVCVVTSVCLLFTCFWWSVKKIEKMQIYKLKSWKNHADRTPGQVLRLTPQTNGSDGVQFFNCQSHFHSPVWICIFCKIFPWLF